MNYKGTIIEESLTKLDVLGDVKIQKTKVSKVTKADQTPWIKQWTIHTVEIEKDKVAVIAEKISQSLDREHGWYADFKNEDWHYIIYRDMVFKVDRRQAEQYELAKQHGLTLGILDYQLDFLSIIK